MSYILVASGIEGSGRGKNTKSAPKKPMNMRATTAQILTMVSSMFLRGRVLVRDVRSGISSGLEPL